jgi:hypothetical protein
LLATHNFYVEGQAFNLLALVLAGTVQLLQLLLLHRTQSVRLHGLLKCRLFGQRELFHELATASQFGLQLLNSGVLFGGLPVLQAQLRIYLLFPLPRRLDLPFYCF